MPERTRSWPSIMEQRGPRVSRYRPPADAAVALADGRVFRGRAFGASADASGEAVMTTTMTGYQEVCSDPSFRGQIVCMTYPLIGNYGVNAEDDESRRPWIAGLIVREWSDTPSHWRSTGTIDDYLKHYGIPGIAGVDTRAFARHIRTVGDTRAVLIQGAADQDDAGLAARARAALVPGEHDVVGEVLQEGHDLHGSGDGPHIVVIDCGVKRNIVRSLARRGARVTVVPYGISYDDIQRLEPDGIIISPGPGDPANLDSGLGVVQRVIDERVPFFGICLGHQLLARAIGAETSKLKYGHRGGNHPVIDRRTGRVSITSQNHSYRVDAGTIPVDQGWQA
ncbi:MAG TPA: glutamine-hydrolyzing carbamoyl-phosphate synthase small subunit, partial [Thermomicrobiales bacterium]|nr:glutamine-hydrolyzing carbamoyl-phosphate synthase small subunit [Thermomicrobiales bacterium]